MAILEKFTKQPIEVEIYAIQFAEDMAATDSITSGHQVVTHNGKSKGLMVLFAPYTATAADDRKTLRTNSSVTLPADAADGYTLYVGNTNQSAAISVGPTNIPARGSSILVRSAGNWIVEASATGIIVAAPGDQRIRIVFVGGLDGNSYKAELTAITSEGRTMQDELIIKVRES